MQALSDEQQMGRLERKVDDGFVRLESKVEESTRELRSEVLSARSEGRQDFRTLLAVIFGMWATTVLAVVAILLNHV